MAKHWRDQFKDNTAARAAEEEKRVAQSEGWESGGDPGPNARSNRRSVQLGSRNSSSARPQFVRGGGKAGISIRVGGGVPFEKERKEPAAPAASDTAPSQQPADVNEPAPSTSSGATNPAPVKRGLLTKLSSLFGSREED